MPAALFCSACRFLGDVFRHIDEWRNPDFFFMIFQKTNELTMLFQADVDCMFATDTVKDKDDR